MSIGRIGGPPGPVTWHDIADTASQLPEVIINSHDMPSLNIDWSKIAHPESVFQRFPGRRSTVYSTKGIVSSSQPLATEAGLEILRKGGNAGKL